MYGVHTVLVPRLESGDGGDSRAFGRVYAIRGRKGKLKEINLIEDSDKEEYV